MAEVSSDGGGGKKKHGKQRAKKSSTRIDMTPMVDLGFLLLTFFILTTTLSKPQAMKLNMPKERDDTVEPLKVDKDHTLNLLLTKNNIVYWYFGIADPAQGALPALNRTSYGANGLRKLLIAENNKRHNAYNYMEDLKKQVKQGKLPPASLPKKRLAFLEDKAIKASLLYVYIKADKESKYKNMVDVLDEMAVCNVGNYVLVETNSIEDQMIANANTYAK